MVKNIKLLIAYEGTDFYGWQATRDLPSVENILQAVLQRVLQEKIHLEAASRTDRGVHAEGQVVQFLSQNTAKLEQLVHSLNCLLPKSIRIVSAEEVPLDFHPTLDAVGKEYHYHLCYGKIQNPKERLFSWHTPYPLDLSLMRCATEKFLGVHDFKAFSNQRKLWNYKNTLREINAFQLISLNNERLLFIIRGKNFLYKMVRNLIGTVVYVGQGKFSIEYLEHLLKNGSRIDAGITAPAHGLSLMRVFYSEEDYNVMRFLKNGVHNAWSE